MSTDAIRFTAVTPNLIVRDIAASTRFYTEVLGFTINQTVPDAAPFVFVWLERGGVTVEAVQAGAAVHRHQIALLEPADDIEVAGATDPELDGSLRDPPARDDQHVGM